MLKRHALRPFELLKLIRDGVVSNIFDVKYIGESGLNYKWDEVFKIFHSLGFITITKEGKVKPTERIKEFQNALDISLSQLAPYGANSVVCNPIFGSPSDPPHSTDIFVLMPFSEEFKAVYDDHILNVAKKLELTVSRADDFFAANSIISDIWDAINSAQIIIADCSGRNPNVFYELGIAHTLGKSVILIAQQKENNDLPFDIRHIRGLFYEFTPRGMQNFESYLETLLSLELERTRTISDHLIRRI